MNRTTQHSFEPEEVMAYLDGELEQRRAVELAAHLEHCEDCRSLASQFRQLSERLLDFAVEPYGADTEAVLSALAEVNAKHVQVDRSKSTKSWPVRLRPWALAGAFALIIVVGAIVFIGVPLTRPSLMSERSSAAYLEAVGSPAASRSSAAEPTNKFNTQARSEDEQHSPYLAKIQPTQPAGPMIAQTASLTIVANNYEKASSALGQLAAGDGGYVQKLSAEAHAGESRQVSATLRVPAKQLDSFLTELQKLGRVEQESQANDEVTDQYVDLGARIKSARASEQRMLDLLATRTGKLEDVLDAERELARIRGEIEGMEGQQYLLAHRVDYATVDVQLHEEYRQQLGAGRSSAITQIRNAAVEGFGNFEDGVIAVLLFALDYGLSILFWSAIVGVPGWLIWRRFRSHRTARN